MDILYSYGINDNEIKNLLCENNYILFLNEDDIIDSINILKCVGCKDNTIKNIIINNPLYLTRSKRDVINLIDRLKMLGIKSFDSKFNDNPWLLNFDYYDL